MEWGAGRAEASHNILSSKANVWDLEYELGENYHIKSRAIPQLMLWNIY